METFIAIEAIVIVGAIGVFKVRGGSFKKLWADILANKGA